MAKALSPQSALPSSENSVHERLLALESKQLAYRSLSHRLLQLPQKLRRRALVPVGPRLYLPGELVRTNEILVLLGSAGEATYFAERSAWQAHEIVRRRLGRVERGLRELLDDESDGEHNVGASLASNVRVVPKVADDSNRTNVTDANTVAEKEANDSAAAEKSVLSRGTEPASVLKSATSAGSATKEKKRVRFSDPLIHPSQKSTPQPCFISPPRSKSKGKRKKSAASSSRSDAKSAGREQAKSKLLAEIGQVVEKAQKQVLDDGIVNITEVYEGEEETPSRVELPRGFEPDKNINFADDSEEFLDMSRANSGVEEDGETSREDYLDALAEVEKESQIEEERVATEKRKSELEREKKEFGKGLAKGFFGAPAKAVRSGAPVPSTQVANTSAASTVRGVVERKPSRKAKRRHRRPRSGASALPASTPAALVPRDTRDRAADGDDDDDGHGDRSQPSVFLQLRALGKDAAAAASQR